MASPCKNSNNCLASNYVLGAGILTGPDELNQIVVEPILVNFVIKANASSVTYSLVFFRTKNNARHGVVCITPKTSPQSG